MSDQLAVCDSCDLQFAIEMHYDRSNGERATFDCPYCDTTYLAYHMSKKGLRLRNELQREYANLHDTDDLTAAWARIDTLRQQLAGEARRAS